MIQFSSLTNYVLGVAAVALPPFLLFAASAQSLCGFTCPEQSYDEIVSNTEMIFSGVVVSSEYVSLLENTPSGDDYIHYQKIEFLPLTVYRGSVSSTVTVLNTYAPSAQEGEWGLASVGSEWIVLANARDDYSATLYPSGVYPDVNTVIFACSGSSPLAHTYLSAPILEHLPEPIENRLPSARIESEITHHFAFIPGVGVLSTRYYPWIQSPSLGYLWDYEQIDNTATQGTWCFSQQIGNIWILNDYLPWVYSSDRTSWVYLYGVSAGKFWIYSNASGEWSHTDFQSHWYQSGTSFIPDPQLIPQ